VDVLDNLVFGSTPESGFGASPYYLYDVFNESQLAPRTGLNSLTDSIQVKRAYGEVSTPVGVLRFGRMGSHWGMGMLYNDGNCLDCDWGDTVDRLQFVTEVFEGFYVAPMLDFNVEGPLWQRPSGMGESVDLTNLDDAHSYVLAIARRDTEQQRRAKLEADQTVFNYGLHFSYRTQRWAAVEYYDDPTLPQTGVVGDWPGNINNEDGRLGGFVQRGADLYIPDVWVKLERKDWRLELEVAGIFGSMATGARSLAELADDRANQALQVVQFGGTLQGEYRFLEGNLKLQMELGLASGDKAYGLGNRPGRNLHGKRTTERGDIDGRQYGCPTTGGCDVSVRNFQFDRDYRVDMILWRDLLGSVTDAAYAKPSLSYQVAPGLQLFGAAIYSRTLYAQSSPSGDDPNLGIELNAGASYETDDGFIANVRYGVLFPLGGFNQPGVELEVAQSVRGMLGIRF